MIVSPRRGRRLVVLSTAGILMASASTAAAATPVPQPADDGARRQATLADDRAVSAGGIDGEAMRQQLIASKQAPKPDNDRSPANAIRVTEKEQGGDKRSSATRRVTAPRGKGAWNLRLNGSLGTKTKKAKAVAPSPEDDGSIRLAHDLTLSSERPRVTTTGRIGDGPHGSQGAKTGDHDFYKLRASAGDTLTVDVDPGGELLPQLFLYDAKGKLVIGAQDATGTGDVHLNQPIAKKGTYYLAVATFRPDDPFDPSSGRAVLSEGPYRIDASLRDRSANDIDRFAIPLRKGDVLGASVKGSARRIAVHDSRGRLLQASQVDAGGTYPKRSPLPRNGNATTNHIVDKTGLYVISISDGTGRYSAAVGVHRPRDLGRQTILLDFTGPRLDNRVFGGSVLEPGVRDLSPMSAFLPRWGLRSSDERAVIEATTRRVKQALRDEIAGSNVRVVSSLTHPNIFGRPGVSRVVIGGSAAEAGVVNAFGVSESVDPGNFAREETALVLPDPMSNDEDPRSLNFRMTADSYRVRAVSQAMGNTAIHEIGHFLGNYHTDDFTDRRNAMNTGYLLHFFAVGRDGVAGTRDDVRIGLRESRYDPLQGLAGIQSSRTRTSIALR